MNRISLRLATIPVATSQVSSASQTKLAEVLQNLQRGEVFLLDGGTGEELFRRGVPDDRKIWSAKAIVDQEYHSIVKEVHASFLEAGSLAITTNSYGIVPGVGFTYPDKRYELISVSGKLARETVSQYHAKIHQEALSAKTKSTVFVLGSLGPLSESYRADLILPHEEGVQGYVVAMGALRPHVDAFIAETLSCISESMQVLDAFVGLSKKDISYHQLPLLLSFTLSSDGNLRDGQKVPTGLRRLLEAADEKRVKIVAFLFNCSEPEAITVALRKINDDQALVESMQSKKVRLGAYANRLTAVDPNWTMEASVAPQPFRKDLNESRYWNDFVQQWVRDFNVQLVGGCCGITPEHIAYIHDKLEKQTT